MSAITCVNRDTVLYKELKRLTGGNKLAADRMATVVTELQDMGLIGKHKHFNTYTIPKKVAPLELTRKLAFEKDVKKYRDLKIYLKVKDIEWITVDESTHRVFFSTPNMQKPISNSYSILLSDVFDLPASQTNLKVVEKVYGKPISEMFTKEALDNQTAVLLSTSFMDLLGASLKTKTKVITEAEAVEYFKRRGEYYNGQMAFITAEGIYFIAGKINTRTVLHEFGHVLIRAIKVQNPELYIQLRNSMLATTQGNELVETIRREYPEYNNNIDKIEEEALVTLLEEASIKKIKELEKDEPGYANFLTNLLAAVRKVFRKLYNKLSAHKLDSNTTLEQLAELMIKDKVTLAVPLQLSDDYIFFKKNYEQINEKLAERIGEDKLTNIINKTYNEMSFQLETLRNSPHILVNELKKSSALNYLNSIKQTLSSFQTVKGLENAKNEDVLQAYEMMNKELHTRLIALATSLQEIENFVDVIENALKNIDDNKLIDGTLGIQQVMYFESFLTRQLEFINEIKKEVKLPNDNEFMAQLDTIANKLAGNSNRTKQLKFDFVMKFFEQETERIKPAVVELLSDKVKGALKKHYDDTEIQDIINKITLLETGKEYTLEDLGLDKLSKTEGDFIKDAINRYLVKRIDNDMIENFITGRRGDLGALEAWIVPYSNIDDPIIGSTIMWMRKIESNAEQESIAASTDFGNKIVGLLNQLNWSPNKTTMLAELLLEEDTIGTENEKGEFVKQKVYTFKNSHINWRGDLAELEHKFQEALNKDDQEAAKEAYKELKTWKDKYLFSPYKPEYKNLQKIWETENTVINPFTNEKEVISAQLAQEARFEKNAAFAKVRLYSQKSFKDSEQHVDHTMEQEATKEYQQLFNIKNPDGTSKTGDELKKVLLRNEYKKKASKFYEYLPMTGRLQDDFNSFLTELHTEGINEETNKEEFDRQIKDFEKRYMRQAFSDSFYKDRTATMEKMREITDKYKEQYPELVQKTALLDEKNALLMRDSFGTVNGLLTDEEASKRILEIDKELNQLNLKVDIKTGLSKEEGIEYNSLKYRYSKANGNLNAEDLAQYNMLKAKIDMKGMSQEDAILYQELLNRYFDLVQKTPTDYYLDAFLYAIGNVEVESITKETADEYINNEEIILKAIAENPSFKTWFLANHYQQEYYSKGEKTKKWVRSSQWSQSLPKDENHIQKTILKNPITNETIALNGVPSGKYTFTKVKNEFMTIPFGQEKQYEGKFIDNKGNFLPRPFSLTDPNSAFDDKYVNKDYERLKKENGAQFKLLEEFKSQMLQIQQFAPGSAKLYYDLPRIRLRGNLESLQRGATQEKYKTTLKDVVYKVLPKGKKDLQNDAGTFGFDYSLEKQLVTTDLKGEQISKIPVVGLSNISTKETSVDVINAVYQYMHSVNLAKHKMKNETVSRAILDVLGEKENGIKDMTKASRQTWLNNKSWQFLQKGDNKRLGALETLVDRFFYGNFQGNFEAENPIITRLTNTMMGAASRSFIALDIPSAVKNRWGMIFQNHIEAAGGKYMDFQSYAKGRIRATKSIIELSSKGIYKMADRPKDVTLMEMFDPIVGKTKKDFGKNTSRSMTKDLFDLTWLYDFRRFAEVEASLQVFWGMMYKHDVEQIQPDGTVKKIKYADAWDKAEDGSVVLKPGINPEYGNKFVDHIISPEDTLESIAKQYNIPIESLKKNSGKTDNSQLVAGELMSISKNNEFNEFKFKVQGVGKKLNGLMSDLDNPQANKFLGFRLFTFYKKFATGMFLNRYQADMDKDNRWGHVYDFEMGEMNRGYTVSAVTAMIKMVKTGGKYYPMMTTDEKIAFRKILAEGVQLLMIVMATSLLFGYDMGDKDRFEKMKRREKKYGMFGWMGNHLLYQLMMVKTENEAFTPYLGVSQSLGFVDKTSIAFGPTVNLYTKIGFDLIRMITGDSKAVYKADVGPYDWQKKGHYKLWNHLFGIMGVKGKTWDPKHAIKMAEIFENLK
jgi:LysM repeat protein